MREQLGRALAWNSPGSLWIQSRLTWPFLAGSQLSSTVCKQAARKQQQQQQQYKRRAGRDEQARRGGLPLGLPLGLPSELVGMNDSAGACTQPD